MFSDTMGCTERHKDLSEGVRENMGAMGRRYSDITKKVRNIMGTKRRTGPWWGSLA
jgi:hypothetical protein